MSSSSSGQPGDKPPVIVKKYANRRLYNTATSSYVTLDDLATMIKEGGDFVVQDAKTGEDLTRSVMTQIIVEQEQKGQKPPGEGKPENGSPRNPWPSQGMSGTAPSSTRCHDSG